VIKSLSISLGLSARQAAAERIQQSANAPYLMSLGSIPSLKSSIDYPFIKSTGHLQ